MTNNSHNDCDHDATKAARTACRKLRAQGIDTTLGQADLIANRLHRKHPDHTRNCHWHNAMAYLENWDLSQHEDPTAEWCKGEPSHDVVFNGAENMIGFICNCD